MNRVLNEHPQIASYGESLFWGSSYVEPGDDGRYTVDQIRALGKRLAGNRWGPHGNGAGVLRSVDESGYNGELHRKISKTFHSIVEPKTPTECFQLLCDIVCESEGKVVAVEKTPHHLNWTQRILTAFPHTRFVVMMREPYEFMLSYKYQGGQLSGSANRNFKRRYHPLLAAVVWRGYRNSADALKHQASQQALIVHLHEIKRDEKRVLESVQHFLGVTVEPLNERVTQTNSSFTGHELRELDAADVFWMNLIAGRLMQKHGYATRPIPRSAWPVVKSMARLPWWGCTNLLDMRRRVKGSLLQYLVRWVRPAGSS